MLSTPYEFVEDFARKAGLPLSLFKDIPESTILDNQYKKLYNASTKLIRHLANKEIESLTFLDATASLLWESYRTLQVFGLPCYDVIDIPKQNNYLYTIETDDKEEFLFIKTSECPFIEGIKKSLNIEIPLLRAVIDDITVNTDYDECTRLLDDIGSIVNNYIYICSHIIHSVYAKRVIDIVDALNASMMSYIHDSYEEAESSWELIVRDCDIKKCSAGYVLIDKETGELSAPSVKYNPPFYLKLLRND